MVRLDTSWKDASSPPEAASKGSPSLIVWVGTRKSSGSRVWTPSCWNYWCSRRYRSHQADSSFTLVSWLFYPCANFTIPYPIPSTHPGLTHQGATRRHFLFKIFTWWPSRPPPDIPLPPQHRSLHWQVRRQSHPELARQPQQQIIPVPLLVTLLVSRYFSRHASWQRFSLSLSQLESIHQQSQAH